MRVWLLNASEASAYLTPGQRPMRTGLLVDMMLRRGHEVVLWKSTFDHVRKRHLATADTTLHPAPRLTIHLLHSRGYKRHVSFARLADHWQIGRRFRQRSATVPRPDAIVCSLPILELASETMRYAAQARVPAVLDIRDWWPDVFLYEMSPAARAVAVRMLRPYFRMAERACVDATAITGITDAFVDWGLAKAGRSRGPWDRAFPHGYTESAPSEAELQDAAAFWKTRHGIAADDDCFTVVFVGSMANSLDLSAIIDAARELGPRVRFVLCGDGDRRSRYVEAARDLPNVVLPGWVGRAAIHVLLRIARIGLCPLPDRPDFLATINNKTIEYLSAGLPILSTPDAGTVASLLREHGCGVSGSGRSGREIAQAIERLRQDPEELARMSQRASALFAERFPAEKVYADMCLHVERMAADARQDAA